MCGIYGTTLRYDKEVIRKKLDLMNFRGPDYQAFLHLPSVGEGQVTLGHVRLSIIDLDPRSNQPFNYNDNISIVFNGEVYNYKELRKQYLSDVTFRTESDTEVICAMYEKFGLESVKYFNGMFAYVIYDRQKNILVGARDRLGKKPFYYRHLGNCNLLGNIGNIGKVSSNSPISQENKEKSANSQESTDNSNLLGNIGNIGKVSLISPLSQENKEVSANSQESTENGNLLGNIGNIGKVSSLSSLSQENKEKSAHSQVSIFSNISPLSQENKEIGFEFASQIKSIAYGNHLEIDDTARSLYLLQGVLPDPYCIFKGVKKLRAGECFTYDIATNDLKVEKYWDIHTNSCGFTAPKTYEEAKETVKELLFDAVKIRLNADVPVGTFLSGGIDSSLVCAIVSKYNKNLCAYTARFENKKFDESIYAVDTANYLGVPVKVCDCTGDDLMSVFNDYLEYFDEPFADDSLIPTSLVAQKARQDVTVILGGDGGDELFYGYPKYEWTKSRLEQYKKPYWLRKLMTPYFAHRDGKSQVFQSTQRDYADVYRSLGMFCYSMEGCEKFDRIELGRLQPDAEYLFSQRQQGPLGDKRRRLPKQEQGTTATLKRAPILDYSDYDIKTFMNAVNQKVDRATMRCSLELRSPIMDYRVAEYSRVLPYEYLNGKYGLKTILKDILYEMVPREMLERPKQGFIPPTKDWFRGALKEEMMDIVSLDNIKNLLPELDAERFIMQRDRFLAGEMENSRMFFTVYTYIKWYQRYAS